MKCEGRDSNYGRSLRSLSSSNPSRLIRMVLAFARTTLMRGKGFEPSDPYGSGS